MAGTLTNGVVHKFSDGQLVITDGAAGTCTVHFEEASLSWDISNSFTWHKDRGALDHRRQGEEEPVTVSFSCKYTALQAKTLINPYEAITGTLGASGWTSTTAATSDVHSVDLTLSIGDAIGAAEETILFNDFAYNKISISEGEEANTISFSGDCVSLTISGS